ncbi:MAG: hypothetical protein AAF542_22585 [Pseudomonadota bacterium]
MLKPKLLAALLLGSIVLTGCSDGDEGDAVSITINENVGGGTDTPDPTPEPPADPNCDAVVDAGFASCDSNTGIVTLNGTIDQDYTLTADREWRLQGVVVVGDGNQMVSTAADVQAIRDAGVTLTIEPGTNVRAFDDGTLLVTRGSMLMADGTAAEPITFSSVADADFDGLGEWGGVIIQGFAPQYGAGGTGACFGTGEVCNVEGEGGTDVAVYGGNDEADNSGIVRYVRIAEGGLVAGPNNEINGLTLQGVGHGTIVEYVQVHNNLDDGVEWFGGTVNARYLVLTGNDDDDIDYDEGFQGNIQYAIIQKDPNKEDPTGSNDPRGIEANSSDDEFVPETDAVIANVTIIGSTVNNDPGGSQPGMRLRGALTTAIFNTAVQNFDTGCIRIDDADTDGDSTDDQFSTVALTNVIGDCADGFYDRRAADTEAGVGVGANTTFTLSSSYAINESIAVLGTAPVINAVNNGSGFMFDQTAFIGAVDPAEATGWWEGWTIPGSLASATPDSSPAFVSCDTDNTVCTLTGRIDEDYTLVRGVEWRLSGEVIVGNGNVTVSNDTDVQNIRDNGVTLTIEAGVDVRAFDDGSLLVTRGSMLDAVGTAASPITFSSVIDDDFDGEGEWGGVIVQGFAPQYGAGGTGACFGAGTVCNVEGEGGTVIGNYGGNDPADNSGRIRYVRIAEGGLVAGPNNEINGLTLQGVGHGTLVEYVQVHNNLDDGVEWFGGTVNARYLVLTNNDDDDIDYDEGYQGNIQYAIIRKNPNKADPTGSNDPRGIEANSSDDEFVPETNATLANILVVGSDVNNDPGGSQPGMRLRGALTTAIYNTAVARFDTFGCIRIDDADTDGDSTDDAFSNVTLVNVGGDCTAGFYSHRVADSETNVGPITPLMIDAAWALENVEATVAAPGITAVANGSGFVFDDTTYIGAVEPGTAANEAWWAGWIIPGSLD